MKTLTANEAKQTFGQVLDAAQSGPVLIQKHNRPTAVILSIKEYVRIREINLSEFSALCDRVGDKARKNGLTEKALMKLLHEA
jgi:prevent-host-death family protein